MITSQVENPVAYIWYWLSCDDGAATGAVLNSSLPRAEVIKALTEQGIAAGTISVQRHKFLKASAAEREARVRNDIIAD